MKTISIAFIYFYQVFVSPFVKQTSGVSSVCRFYPSCSVYAKSSIKKYGFLKGTYMSFLRILSCRPF